MVNYNLKRIDWIDTCRGIAIFLVVFAHFPLENRSLHYFIYSFHVPLFFLISGYLQKNKIKSIKDELIKNFNFLIIPYFTFCIICILFSPAWNLRPNLDIFSIYNRIFMGLFLGEGVSTSISEPACVPVWFLISLFWIRTLFLGLIAFKLNKHLIFISITLCLLVANYLLKKESINVFFSLDSSMIGFYFYYLGFLLKEYDIFNRISRKYLLILSVIVFFILLYFNYLDLIHMDINNSIVFEYYILTLFVSTIACMSCISIVKYFHISNKYTDIISKYSLQILGLHVILTDVFANILIKILNSQNFSSFLIFPLTIITLVLLIFIIKLLKNRIPKLIGIKNE